MKLNFLFVFVSVLFSTATLSAQSVLNTNAYVMTADSTVLYSIDSIQNAVIETNSIAKKIPSVKVRDAHEGRETYSVLVTK